MLQSVRFINYRGLKDTTIPLSQVTLLTGTNGIGKTSVLEGMYFLLAHTVTDAAVFLRYPQFMQSQGNMSSSTGLPNKQIPLFINGYDYPSFWKECPTDGVSECQVEADLADSGDRLRLSWEAKISDFSELDEEIKKMAAAYGLQGGVGVPYVLWKWRCTGKIKDSNSNEKIDVDHSSKAVQQLCFELRCSPRIGTGIPYATCYVDMSSARYMPNKLSFKTEKFLVEALKLINSNVTGVRNDGIPSQLRVIINDESERSLGTLGVGAETLTSVLLMLSELQNTSTNNYLSAMFLADEIGAGIHYSKLEKMWSFLLEFLLKYPQIQMVLTTHSRDCVNSFCKTFQNKNPGMAHIVRMHKFDEKDGVQTTVYTQEMYASILSGEWEIRG